MNFLLASFDSKNMSNTYGINVFLTKVFFFVSNATQLVCAQSLKDLPTRIVKSDALAHDVLQHVNARKKTKYSEDNKPLKLTAIYAINHYFPAKKTLNGLSYLG